MIELQQHRAAKPAIWIPLAVTVALSCLFWFLEADFWIMDRFFDAETGRFHPKREGLPGILYRFGPTPGLIVAVVATVIAVLALFVPRAKRYWRIALFVCLAMIIGPGIVVNTIFKENFGRPRPIHVERYGGPLEYHRLWEPGSHEVGVSFPSGHASTGFFWLAGYFVFFRHKPSLARAFLCFGIGFGLAIGTARMMQGGHWPSDVLWAGVFCYFVSYGLFFLIRPDRFGSESGMRGVAEAERRGREI